MGDQVGELNKAVSNETENRKKELSDVRKELLYLEAYSRRKNLKFVRVIYLSPGVCDMFT